MMGTALPTVHRGGVEYGPTAPKEDVITAKGPDRLTVISDKVFDLRQCPAAVQDEIIAGVDGARVKLSRCLILGGIKPLFAGNGDHPGNDMLYAQWEIEDCVILGGGRRCAEAQDFAQVIMRRCWVHDWGQTFDVRAFGAWAHRGGRIVAEDCLFTQSGGLFSLGLLNFIKDFGNHIGQSVNDYGLSALLRARTYMPGVCRGLTADTGGIALATRCYRNRPWIKLENCDPFIFRQDAIAIAERIDAAMPPQAYERLGMSVLELFYTIAE